MWSIVAAVDANDIPLEKNRRDFFTRKYPEAVGLLDKRLNLVRESLDAGMQLHMALSRNWVHPEKAGVFAVCVNNPALRLYFLPLPEKRELLTLSIGDKNRQSADVVATAGWAKSILLK